MIRQGLLSQPGNATVDRFLEVLEIGQGVDYSRVRLNDFGLNRVAPLNSQVKCIYIDGAVVA